MTRRFFVYAAADSLLAALLPNVAAAMPQDDAAPVILRNPYMEATIRGGLLSGLRAAPDGSGKMRPAQFVRDLRPEFWEVTAETRVTRTAESNAAAATVGPLRVYQPQPLRIEGGGAGARADRLMPGGTLAQAFRVPERAVFDSVAARIPTWHTTTSGATLRLYRGETLLAERRIENAVDNTWQEVRPRAPQGPGEYRLEMSEPTGQIGWWSHEADVYPNGQAQVDGARIAGDRTLRVDTRAEMGTGTLRIALEANALVIDTELLRTDPPSPAAPPQKVALLWRWQTTWTRAGYDVSPKAGVVFSRFFTNHQRYMPVEQLKRRDHGGLTFENCRWIEMEGTESADLRLSSPREDSPLRLRWEMTDDTLSLRIDTPLQQSTEGDSTGNLLRSRLRVEVLPRADSVPADFPRFAFADPALTRDANRFWWDRAFTYPSPALPAAWFEWMALMRCWYGGPAREGEMRQLETYPITPEGYVHTWRQDIGWPLRPTPTTDTRHFDTNARFILACWRFWRWSGDDAFLKRQADRLRRTMRYQLTDLRGSEGLIVTQSKDVQGRHADQSNNYWDILPFGHLDAYANAVFYASLEAMQEMEAALGVTSEWDWAALRAKTHARYDAVFWDETKDRYIGCVDVDGKRHDYGFTFVNIEALYYGLGDADKARRIYRWMETEPTSSGKPDTYTRFVFAPRATTIHNPMWDRSGGARGASAPAQQSGKDTPPSWWVSWWKGTPYGEQCQDGGAILYVSYFDLMVRLRYFGSENTWKRWQEILGRYRLPDRLGGGAPLYTGEKPQQEDAGQVGVDYPFPESGMVPCFLLYGIIGAEATPQGLRITPRLPRSLPFAEAQGVSWRGAALTIRVTRNDVDVSGRGSDGKPLLWKLPLPAGPDASVLIPSPQAS